MGHRMKPLMPGLILLITLASCRHCGVKVDPPAFEGGNIVLTWQPYEGDASYDIRIYSELDGRCVLAHDGLPEARIAVPGGLPRGRYRWTVRLRVATPDGDRVSPWSYPCAPTPGQLAAVPPPHLAMHILDVK